jgi:hypothetical protein
MQRRFGSRPASWPWATTIRIDGRERQRRSAAAIGPLVDGEQRHLRLNGKSREPNSAAPRVAGDLELALAAAVLAIASARVRCRPTGRVAK